MNITRRTWLIWLAGLLLLVGCQQTPMVTSTPTSISTLIPSLTPTAPPVPTETPTFLPTSTLTPSPTPTPLPATASLSAPLYIYHPNTLGVWRLAPGATDIEAVTPSNVEVSAFDVWLGDGRFAYGTPSGEAFVAFLGEEPRQIYAFESDLDVDVHVNALAWSPDGAWLVYGLRVEDAVLEKETRDAVEPLTGVWLWSVAEDRHVQLVENRYLTLPAEDETGGVGRLRIMTQPSWSPAGEALLFTGSYWEWTDVLWLDPVLPDPAAAELYDPQSQDAWSSGAWTRDGQGVLLSGLNYAAFGGLVWVDRTTLVTETLVSGMETRLYVADAAASPDGIAFFANDEERGLHLYLGQRSGGDFEFAPVELGDLDCPYLGDVAWSPNGAHAALPCRGNVKVVAVDGSLNLDLAPFLPPLTGDWYWRLRWGGIVQPTEP